MLDVARRLRRLLPFLLLEGGLVFAALLLVSALSSAGTPVAPDGGADARVAGCVMSADAAQITYVVTNRDSAEHGYRVELAVDNGTTRIGYGVSVVTQVAPGSTATARAVVPTVVRPKGATCTARAARYDAHVVHHRR
jgi:hypothetical protein